MCHIHKVMSNIISVSFFTEFMRTLNLLEGAGGDLPEYVGIAFAKAIHRRGAKYIFSESSVCPFQKTILIGRTSKILSISL